MAEKAAKIGGLSILSQVDGMFAIPTVATSWAAPTKFEGVSKSQTIVTLKGGRILGDKSKKILKIDIELGSLVYKNFNSTM